MKQEITYRFYGGEREISMAFVAICPYYIKELNGQTFCEVCRFKFKDRIMRNNFVGSYCASFDYTSCPICKETVAYYDRKDNGYTNEEDGFEEII